MKRNRYDRVFVSAVKLSIETINEILYNYEQTGSVSEAARRTGVDFKTAQKYIFFQDRNIPTNPNHFIKNLLMTLINAHPSIHQREIIINITIIIINLLLTSPLIIKYQNNEAIHYYLFI